MTRPLTHKKRNVQITCVSKGVNGDGRQYILSFGGLRPDGKPWRLSEQELILSIESGHSFYIMEGRHSVPVIVAVRHDLKYIKSALDRETPDHLLRLPECK